MALADDWTIYSSDPGLVAVIHTGANKIYGTGSLECDYHSALAYLNMVRKNSPKGFTSGRARYLWSKTSGSAGDYFGLMFCQSQENMTGSSGAAYFCGHIRTGATLQYYLRRHSAGWPTATLLAQSTVSGTIPVAPLSTPIEIRWRLDEANLGGVQITLREGAPANYNGVTLNWDTLLTTTRIDYLDNGAYLTSSVGEGPSYLNASGVPSTTYYMDELEVVPLLVGGLTT